MSYHILQPPFTLKFWLMSKRELRDYFKWFTTILPNRVEELAAAVRTSPALRSWVSDKSPESLDMLGDWFAAQVETRKKSSEELEALRGDPQYPIEVPDYDLSNKTFSVAMDIAMYLTTVFLANHSSLRLEQQWGNKRSIDYGQPILVGFGKVPFNPVRMVVSLAYGIAMKKKDGASLRGVYETWSDMLRKQSTSAA